MHRINPDPSEIKDPLLRRLYDYWTECRGGDRRMPSRRDVDPVEMRYILGHLLLIDVLRSGNGEPKFRVRLHGTELSRRAGYELTGKMLDELPLPEFRALAHRSFLTTVETRAPFHSIRDRILDAKPWRYEALMLPLSSNDDAVDMLLIGMRYDDGGAEAVRP